MKTIACAIVIGILTAHQARAETHSCVLKEKVINQMDEYGECHYLPMPEPEKLTWHLLKQTYDGEMQLVKNLTKRECEFMMHRALRAPATDEEIAKAGHEDDIVASDRHAWRSLSARDDYSFFQRCSALHNCGGGSFDFLKESSGFSVISPSDIKSAECFE